MDPRLISAGNAPTLANTVEERFIGRLTPGSNRFNGSFQAGEGITEQLQDGNAFRVSPRIGAVYDLTGKGETIVRGGFGIFYDRPQGNMVFDMISNAPGVLNSRLDWGRLQDLTSASGDPNPTLSLNPTAFGFKPPRVNQWNIGIQHKLVEEFILDVAYVGSTSSDLLRQVQTQRVTVWGDVPTPEPGSDPRPERDAGSHSAAERLAAAVQGLQQHSDVGLQRLCGLQGAADVGEPPLRSRVHGVRLLGVEQSAGDQQHGL